MEVFNVTLFKPYPFTQGQKIRIQGGKRQGDWEVVGLSEAKVQLRCPVSGRQFEWDRFCYLAEELKNEAWPEE
ncbi:MAG: hypothetical protein HZB87_01550 [Desulfatitalea sp.]|nr:hypothetical protein [Desulfatitalea sp.]MBI5896888.1 hypothetical protein [Desulfobacterales bacterium]